MKEERNTGWRQHSRRMMRVRPLLLVQVANCRIVPKKVAISDNIEVGGIFLFFA